MDNQTERDGWVHVIEQDAARMAFGRPLLMNTYRAVVAEAIVARALDDRWHHCAADWNAYDFKRDDGLALEVKQSAARQSWAKDGDKPSKSLFDIAERQRAYIDEAWVKDRRRWADIYVFAHHPGTESNADHRLPHQWTFYVARESDLPVQKSLSLSRVMRLSASSDFENLAKTVALVADRHL